MPKRAQQLRFFTDENVPDSVARYLQRRGHSVWRAKSHLPEGTPDPVVATTAMQGGRILVSQDKDFNHQRFAQPKFAKLSRIGLVGPGPTLVDALKEYIHLIEAEWAKKKGARMIVRVQVGQIKFNR